MAPNGNLRATMLLCIFAASGFAGLVYESIWTQYLGLILGHSAYAQVLVLALFMGGMALGAWLTSRRSELLARPLVAYAVVEFILGVVGVGFHAYYSVASGWAYDVLFPAVSPGLTLELARWSMAGILILPQCILLGMTFPLMSAAYLRWQPNAGGEVLAGLYFSNSLGAAIGALTSTFVLIPAVGLPGTVLTAGIAGILVAMAAWSLTKADQAPPAVKQHVVEAVADRSAPVFILFVAAITGATSFVYEISWIRMLSMVLGSTIHAFELTLAAFIAGIAFGGLWLRKRADHLNSPRRAAGWAQVVMGCMALSTLFLYNQSFSWLAWVMQNLNRSAESAYTAYNFASAAIAMVIMFPTAFFAGMTLPLLTLTLLKDGAGESAIGKTYAANTLGAIIGVVLAVFVGLPMLGLRLSLWLGAAADIAVGSFLLISLRHLFKFGIRSVYWKIPIGIGVSIVLLGLTLALSHFDPLLMSSGVFRDGRLALDERKLKGRKVLFHKDGKTASVALLEFDGTCRSIITNGKSDASIAVNGNELSSDEMTMTMLGALPMIYRPKAAAVAIIGFGSGMTTHTVLGNPRIAAVDTIEIEPAMVEGAQYFRPFVERAFADPRSHIVIDDAKSYFATSRKRYDIIISEPSNPWVNGVASLFTDEFYRFIPMHLNEDGIFVQWIHVYEMTPTLIDSIARAMLPHFADTRLFLSAKGTDWILIASPTHKLPDTQELRLPDFWDQTLIKAMAQRGLATETDLMQTYLGDRNLLQAYTDLRRSVPTNSDFFPYVQLNAPQARFAGAGASELITLRVADWPISDVLNIPSSVSLAYKPSAFLTKYLIQGNAIARAQALHSILADRPKSDRSDTSLADRTAADRLRAAGLSCQIDALGDDGLLLMSSLAVATTPYLRPEDSIAIWQHASWMRCPPRTPLIRDYFAFIGAVAARDHGKILRLGQDLLDGHIDKLRQTDQLPALDYIVGAMQLSAYASGDFRRVISLDQHKLVIDFSRSLLVHLAREKIKSN
jgi:spermidine synthase